MVIDCQHIEETILSQLKANPTNRTVLVNGIASKTGNEPQYVNSILNHLMDLNWVNEKDTMCFLVRS